MKFVSDFTPQKEHHGKWFFIRYDTGVAKVKQFKQVHVSSAGEVYLCPQSDYGMDIMAYGTPLSHYSDLKIEFCGPIELPDN